MNTTAAVISSDPSSYARARRSRHTTELKDFIRFPSVSAQPQHAADVQRCARWLVAHLQNIGLEHAQIIPTPRHPLVYADWLHAPHKPTVLIYGHYDVQPAEPLKEWHTPPFKPVIRDGNLYGRGASDDKGQLFAHVKALEAWLKTRGRLPVNVKCLFEGEEEIGSPNLKPFLQGHQQKLAAEVAVMSDTRFLAAGQPALTYALRGGLSMELELSGPQGDLHSGNFGGAVHNPLQALCEIIAQLHDCKGRIAIPGFYDCVRRWDAAERAFMAANGPTDEQLLHDARTTRGWGERGYSLYERVTIRPALSVTGLSGGYQGPGVKAVIPARATAKLNFRLVPDQDPTQIERLVREHLSQLTPSTVRATVRTHLQARPALTDRQHPAMRAAAQAYQHGFGVRPVWLRSGGTIPVVNAFQELLQVPVVLMGFALPDDRLHAPNEKFHLSQFYRGIATCLQFLELIGQLPPSQLPTNRLGRAVKAARLPEGTTR